MNFKVNFTACYWIKNRDNYRIYEYEKIFNTNNFNVCYFMWME
ncbi:hypothetical protein TPENAI_30031 [Tenacibaculum litopenaei]